MGAKLEHLFILDPLIRLEFNLDTSIRLAYALSRLGHQVYMAELKDLHWHSHQPSAGANVQELLFSGEATKIKTGPIKARLLDTFNSIHMRKDPPFDMHYITATWFLESAEPKAKVYNQPKALRGINEKLAILKFPDAIAPGLASANAEEILSFIKEKCQGDGIVKPLTLYSGKGIERIDLKTKGSDKNRALTELRRLTEDGQSVRLVQPFDKQVFAGEVRVFTIGGKALSWCLKKPAEGQFLANSSFGSTRHIYQPSKLEITRVNTAAKELAKEGASIVGFDLINGFISEVNITSPRLLTAPEDKTDYFSEFASWVASDCS